MLHYLIYSTEAIYMQDEHVCIWRKWVQGN